MALLKGVIWTVGIGGFGYTLMKILSPDEKSFVDRTSESPQFDRSEAAKKRQAIFDVLKGASEVNKPIYRMTREELENKREQFVSETKTK
uniref:Ubiquinol-cytochrome-c reductase complex assembly factor 3 n=1 Tax=Timema genevievae TaxID=629358 RepID=A0A7R9K1P5_TIMGE|nr:unnamed protein product [Timema genevievae]